MTKSRLGRADSIFKATKADKAAAKVIETPIRPPAGTSVENKLTVILPPGQVDFLDRLALEIRSKTGKKMKRTEIIRALIAGLQGSGMDLSGFGTEEVIAGAIQERLKP
jgi:hypothetical protein